MLLRLIPKIFYPKLAEGIDLFVHHLGFSILYQDHDLAVVGRDGAKAYLVESPEFAAKDRPEITIETDDIDSIYAEVSNRNPQILHPNGRSVSLKPWGAREFAVRDETDVCVIFREWQKQ